MEAFLNHIIETPRLYLRPLTPEDRDDLSTILCDPESMRFYPAVFTLERVTHWIEWNIGNYKKFGHGLWAVVLKDWDIFLGDCGITLQDIEGEMLPELGYHIKKEYWNRGYATEAARACMEYAFNELNCSTLYTYVKHDNLPSIRVAEKNGMRFVKYFEKTVMGSRVKEALYMKQRPGGS